MRNEFNIISFDYINKNNRTRSDVLFGIRMIGVIDNEEKKNKNEKLSENEKED